MVTKIKIRREKHRKESMKGKFSRNVPIWLDRNRSCDPEQPESDDVSSRPGWLPVRCP